MEPLFMKTVCLISLLYLEIINSQYANQILIFPEGSGNQHIECNNDCTNLEVYYGAEGELMVLCNSAGACDGIKVYCGNYNPPGPEYSADDMNGPNIDCEVWAERDPRASMHICIIYKFMYI